jgi:mono/diheme cytochrome c family protein/REP element-mobilizing transposase RayT
MKRPSPKSQVGRARPPGAPQRKILPHDRPLWIRPEDEIYFVTICCEKRGHNQLCHAQIRDAIWESIQRRQESGEWYVHLCVLMPDHLHALVTFPDETVMRKAIADWKRFLATHLKIEWQRDFFDHRLRRDESFDENAAYLRASPVRAGLVVAPEEWRYIWVDAEDDVTQSKRTTVHGAPGGRALPIFLAACCLLFACRRDMYDQPKAKPLAENGFFKNGASARQIPPHTVSRGDTRENLALSTGLTNGLLVTRLPLELTPELLRRGRKRYDIYCAACHGRTGDGNGEIVRRGFPAPPTYHIDRLRDAPIGHFYDVITNGYGVMSAYADKVERADRWAIAVYIRALQLSHNAKPEDVAPNEQSKLEAAR